MGYANHFHRFSAFAIDLFILWAFITVTPILSKSLFSIDDVELRKMSLILTMVSFLYFPVFELSKWQGSIGKRFMKLKVTNTSGNRISAGTALGRMLGRLLDVVTYGIGLAMVLWTKKRQTLHDKIASTVVVMENTDITFFEQQYDVGLSSNPLAKEAELIALLNEGVISQEEFDMALKKLKSDLSNH